MALALTTLTSVSQRQRKAIFIIADGIPADVIQKVKTPTLDKIAHEGAFLKAHVGGEKGSYTQTPTISAVGYNSLLTSTWVNKHNVWDNDIRDPNYNYWTIFRLFKTQYPNKKTAIYSTWLDNRTKLVGDYFAATGNIGVDYHFDGLELDTVKYPHDNDSRYIHLIDEKVTEGAAKSIRELSPDLTWVYLEYTDDMGHQHGDSPQFYNAVETMDAQVKKIWESIQYRKENFGEDWVIYITTDHGRDASTGKNHGGQSDRERNTWIVTNEKNITPYFKNVQVGIVDITPSIASFLRINIAREQKMEIDGVSLVDPVSVLNLQSKMEGTKLELNWKAIEKMGTAKIWVATTNNFKTGGHDQYQQLAEVEISSEHASIELRNNSSSFYKIVMEAPHNFLNTWVIKK